MKLYSDRTVLEVLGKHDSRLMLNYCFKNRRHLEPWEPERNKSHLTEKNFERIGAENHRLMEARSAFKFSALTKDRSEIVGVCNFTNIIYGPFQACNLGYSIAEKHQGTGLMTEILTVGLEYIFSELNLHRVMANYIPSNERSEKILLRLGFEKEGLAKSYLKIAGRWQDHVLTSKLNPKHCLSDK